ncbi:MAG: hypothetical protein ACRCXR_05685, partial [Weissella cibaria]
MKENIVADARLRKMAEDGGGKKWLIRGAATLAMLGGIAAAPQTDTVTERVDDLVQSVLHMAIAPAEAATVSGVTIDNAKEVPSRTTTSSGDKIADYLVKGSAYYQSNNSSGKTTWYGLSNGQNQTGLVVYN